MEITIKPNRTGGWIVEYTGDKPKQTIILDCYKDVAGAVSYLLSSQETLDQLCSRRPKNEAMEKEHGLRDMAGMEKEESKETTPKPEIFVFEDNNGQVSHISKDKAGWTLSVLGGFQVGYAEHLIRLVQDGSIGEIMFQGKKIRLAK